MKTLKSIVKGGVCLILLLFALRTIPGVRFVTDFFAPILFFGKVVDENGNPVPSAELRISFANGLRNFDDHALTDLDGRFWTIGLGLGVVIDASKSGYYYLDQSRSGRTFCYCADGGQLDRHLTPADPGILYLRKMGTTEPLIFTSGGKKISRDGIPLQMNLTTGKIWMVTDGDIVVQGWTNDKNIPVNSHQHYDWRCIITVPGGGIQTRTGGEFDFEAPLDGYHESDEIDMPATADKWTARESRSYFLKLKSGEYGRIDFEMFASDDNFFSIKSYVNPVPDHRNLEYDPAQQVNK